MYAFLMKFLKMQQKIINNYDYLLTYKAKCFIMILDQKENNPPQGEAEERREQ